MVYVHESLNVCEELLLYIWSLKGSFGLEMFADLILSLKLLFKEILNFEKPLNFLKF